MLYTVGTLASMLWWMANMPGLRHRLIVSWMAFVLVCCSATFAVWTSGGGLETRQFTFFVVLAVVCLSLYRNHRWALLAASLSLALAALTRPEVPLIAACCFGWFGTQHLVPMIDGLRSGRQSGSGIVRLFVATVKQLDWSRFAYLIMPFVIVVGAHFLFRYAYYDEWLPNTYYAKHVRPWWDMGIRYYVAAGIETGAYLLVPLAVYAMMMRWQAYRDSVYALVLLVVGLHVIYVMQIGGDHFEWRPMDFYWPLLALPAADGIVRLGGAIANKLRLIRTSSSSNLYAWVLLLFIPILFYTSAMQAALLFEGAKINERIWGIHIDLDEDNSRWLLLAPGMPALTAISNDLRQSFVQQSVGMRFVEHREFADQQIRNWSRYENMERGIIPDDLVYAVRTIGIVSYYLTSDVTIIDRFGLTDKTVARNPVTRPNSARAMAHDRIPPSRYLEERGVNIKIRPHTYYPLRALDIHKAQYVVKVGPDLWMPFDSEDHEWVVSSFEGRELIYRDTPE